MPQISIRIPQEIKSQLDFLARVYNLDLSSLIRDVLIPVSLIEKINNQVRTIEVSERMLVQLIIETPEFQRLLEELEKYIVVDEFWVGWGGQELETFEILFYFSWKEIGEKKEEWKEFEEQEGKIIASTILRRDNKFFPAFLIESGADNSYGSMHDYQYSYHQILSLKELVLWLKIVLVGLKELRDEKLQSIANALEKLKSLVA